MFTRKRPLSRDSGGENETYVLISTRIAFSISKLSSIFRTFFKFRCVIDRNLSLVTTSLVNK